jgi:hypothetical protein
MQGREYRWRRGEIHVSHPQGQHIAALIDVPFKAFGAFAVYRGIEVKWHSYLYSMTGSAHSLIKPGFESFIFNNYFFQFSTKLQKMKNKTYQE